MSMCLSISFVLFLGFSQKKIIDFFRIQKCKDDGDVLYLSAQGKILHYSIQN